MKTCKELADSGSSNSSSGQVRDSEQQKNQERAPMQSTQQTAESKAGSIPSDDKSQGHQMYALLKPWANPKAIQGAAPSLIEDLLRQQQAIEARVLHRNASGSTFWSRSVIFIALIGVSFGCLLVILGEMMGTSSFQWLRVAIDSVATSVARATFTEKLMFTCIAVWLAGTVVLWTASRS